MIAVINVIAPTKSTDIYGEVALHKYPIVVKCKDLDDLKKLLSAQNQYINQLFRTQSLFDKAKYYIRIIDEKLSHTDLIWDVKEINTWL